MNPGHDFSIVEIPPTLVAGLRRKGRYTLIPGMIMEVFGFLVERGICPAGGPVFLCHERTPEAVYAADAAGTADIEIVVPVTGNFPQAGDISCHTLPGGRMVRAFHRGPYQECTSTYTQLFAWLGEQGLAITGPIREIYHNDPREVRPEEILTEILVPVG